MKQRIIKSICALALAATTGCVAFVFVGCRTVSVENNGEGKGWKVKVMSNMMKSEADNIKASVNPDGTISFDMGGYSSSAKSLMTMTYIARIAAAMYSPAAASVPLTDQPADPQAVAALVKAQADAKAALVKAKAEAKAAAPAAAGAQAECTDGNCTPK